MAECIAKKCGCKPRFIAKVYVVDFCKFHEGAKEEIERLKTLIKLP